jgi:pimeloyl-ACP methyl ester carboxylesterase
VNRNSLPELEGVQHQFVDLGGGVTIHVADAGPADGAPVMLVHGFPQHWWEWHELIGPLEIAHSPEADYAFRAVVERERWSAARVSRVRRTSHRRHL